MSSSNDSAPSAGGGAPIAAIPAASIPLEAAESAERTAARVSGVASNAFGVRDSQGIVPLSLPPEASYSSFKAAQDAANAYAGLAGYAIVEGKGRWADPRKKGRERRFLICKHGDSRPREKDGRELNESQRKRGKRQSKKTGCEVRIKVQERPDSSWDLKYLQDSKYQTHNHDFKDIASYSEHRKLTKEQLTIIKADHTAGIQPNRIVGSLKAADPTSHIVTRDIYNVVSKLKSDALQGKRPNEALVEKLTKQKEEGSIFFEYTLSEEGRIEKMFLADIRYVEIPVFKSK
jgi:hypothetical protein